MAVSLEVSPVGEVRDRVTEVVAACLGLRPAEIDPCAPLTLYGLDSLRAVELGAVLEDAFDRALPDGLLDDHPDIDALVQLLAEVDPQRPRALAEDDVRSLMLADSVLPPDIHPVEPMPASLGRQVLLTGATGFLGAYLLKTLLSDTDAEVHCLVRARGLGGSSSTRVRRGLECYNLWDDAFHARIHMVPGDLTQPKLGLTPDLYARLATSVDTIYHAAADVNWVAPYPALRSTNVIGTRELIRLACAGRPKPFHFISSLSVCYAVGGPRYVNEDDDLLTRIERLPLRYAQSKCVAEALVRQASGRGLRSTVHRPALLTGDSITGASKLDDLVAALFKGCIQMGMAPGVDWRIDAVPVDDAARAIVHLSGHAQSGLDSFHVSARRPRHWCECVLWMNLRGYPVSLVPYERWSTQLAHDAASPDHPLHRLQGFFLRRWSEGATVPELYQKGWSSAPLSERTQAVVSKAGLDCKRLDATLLDRYFTDYVAKGFLPAPPRTNWSTGAHEPGVSAHYDSTFFEPLLRQRFTGDPVRVAGVTLCSRGSEHSIIGELTSWRHHGRTGLFHHRLDLVHRGVEQTLDVVTKVKPADHEMIEVAQAVATISDARLGRAVRHYRDRIGLRDAHVRELALYDEPDDRLQRHMPACFGMWRDDTREEWGLLLERLDGGVLIDATDDPSRWTRAYVDAALDGLSEIHAVWLGREDDLKSRSWIGHVASHESMVEMTPLWWALADHATPYLAQWSDPSLIRTHHGLVESVGTWWPLLEGLPRTLIHNDFSPRNVAIRDDGTSLRLCAYDWELATVGAPQCDLAHLLCFVLDPEVSSATVSHYIERHRAALERTSGRSIDPDRWRAGFRAALADLLVNRLMFYVMINRVRPLRFLPRVVRTWQRLHEVCGTVTPDRP